MQPQAPYSSNPSSQLPAGYEFMHDSPPSKSVGPSSTLMRVVLVLGGVIVLFILFSILRGVLSGGSNEPQLLSVAQDQQAIVAIATDAQQQQTLSTTGKYVAINAEATLSSDKSRLLAYMTTVGYKVKAEQLGLKISTSTSKELSDAEVSSTYDSVFKRVMVTKLKTYQQDLKLAYTKTPGKTGRALLDSQYKSSDLLLQQLSSAQN